MNYFEKKITSKTMSFRYAIGNTINSGNEIHPFHEILYYIDGDATFTSDSFKTNLTKGSLIIIPKECYHQFIVKNQDKYKRLVINFYDVPELDNLISKSMISIKIFDAPNTHITNMLNRTISVLNEDYEKDDVCSYLYGTLICILFELNVSELKSVPLVKRENTDTISMCIDYINSHFSEKILLKDIADEINCSVSTLQHTFRKEMGISIYKYITEKRLIKAYNLLNRNFKPTQVYYDCGFGDYASFYKAYTKMFGTSPKHNADI